MTSEPRTSRATSAKPKTPPVAKIEGAGGPYQLPPLPYAEDALAPYISERTLKFHHGKHHAAYIEKTNELVGGTDFEGLSLEQVVLQSAGKAEFKKLFNNSAQAWNHDFFWKSLRCGGGAPKGPLAERMQTDFGGTEKFLKAFEKAADEHFGSGWAWLVLQDGKLKITTTGNADMPLIHGQTPLLNLDVWEHAYYLDYQNKRPEFVAAVARHLLNWDFAEANLKKTLTQKH